MIISDDGLQRLKRREGVVTELYRDSAGLPTIGVGHLLTKDELSSGKIFLDSGAVDWSEGLTDHEVEELLRADVERAEDAVTDLLVTVPELEQRHFDTLVSFVFNVGVKAFKDSTLLRFLKSGNFEAVPEQLRRWVHTAGAVNPGLVKRREEEAAQWVGA